MTISLWVRKNYLSREATGPKYRVIAGVIGEGIDSGQIPGGMQLPTVRQLAKDLAVSETTIAAAYEFLSERKQVEGRVGSGTYVKLPSALVRADPDFVELHGRRPSFDGGSSSTISSPWRRRTLSANAAHLRTAYPSALDCTSGRPNPALLPFPILQRAWKRAATKMTRDQLQYSGPHPLNSLIKPLVPRLEADGIPAREPDIVVGSSAQQLIMLALRVVCTLSGSARLTIGVEEPGYPTIFDSFERLGHQLVGIEVDAHGAVPASLEHALGLGVHAVLFTPRAHNPTGASWSPDRKAAIADLIASQGEVVAIEDDHFAGTANARPGSLFSDERIGDRVIYIRSFSKSLGPDLRIAIAIAKARLRALLMEEKSFADGWTSRLTQSTIAGVLADSELEEVLQSATRAYETRRRSLAAALTSKVSGLARTAPGTDGVSLWIAFSREVGSLEVIEQSAALGVLVAPGEPFYIEIGRHDVVRVNAGSTNDATQAADIGDKLATAILRAAETSSRSLLDSHV